MVGTRFSEWRNGKPVCHVYWTRRLPDTHQTTGVWREEVAAAGIGELYLCSVAACRRWGHGYLEATSRVIGSRVISAPK